MNNINKLPDICFGLLESKEEIVVIKRGVMGYFPQRPENAKWGVENLDYLNEGLGVTKGQATAMMKGSLYGWDVELANPDNYDNDGLWIKKEK